MEQSELLQYVATTLERLHIPYFVTGSVATIFFGEPRFTNNIDIVAAIPTNEIKAFCRAFPAPEYYLSEEAAKRAVSNCSQFNILHPSSGLKVDIIVPPDTPFNRSRFSRTTHVKPSKDFTATFSSAEDVILKKMEYYREGGSDKHLRDIASVMKLNNNLDLDYVARWAEQLDVIDIWRSILQRIAEE